MPLSLVRKSHKALTETARNMDKELLDGLERRGFKLDFGDDDTAQIEKIVEIGGSTIGDDGNDPQIVAIVKHLRQLIGESHVGARQLAAGDADGPIILSLSQCGVGSALLK